MLYDTDANGRYLVHEGPLMSVVCAVRENGSSPAREYLEQLEESNKNKLRQFALSFKYLGDNGRLTVNKLKHEVGKIWAFKKDQHRIACFFDGRFCVLTNGFVKKRDKWTASELDRPAEIMKSDMARLSLLRKGK